MSVQPKRFPDRLGSAVLAAILGAALRDSRQNEGVTTGGLSEGPVTLLVTDVAGSTDLQSRLGDTAARDLMRGHDILVREAVATLGGQEIKATGDGFLVSFTSTRRALECALTIQQRLASDRSPIRVRMGLHAGEVIEEAGDVYGAAVSATARIAARAQSGQILVSDLVRQLAGAAGVVFRECGGVQLKGLEGVWVLHEVIWREAGETLVSASAEESTSSLVGRDSEVGALHQAVDAAVAGRGAVVLLAGEPGFGKTTLALDAASYADRRGARVLSGACWDGGGAPAYWPWIQVLRAYTSDVDDEVLAATAGPGAADVLRLLPELASRLPAAPAAPELEPEQARFRLFDAVASMLCRAASGRPLLIVLDDLHWVTSRRCSFWGSSPPSCRPTLSP